MKVKKKVTEQQRATAAAKFIAVSGLELHTCTHTQGLFKPGRREECPCAAPDDTPVPTPCGASMDFPVPIPLKIL